MPVHLGNRDDQYVLNHCAKYLARDAGEIAEPWRFPIIDAHWDGATAETSYRFNDVTLVYDGRALRPGFVSVVGTFGDLYDPVPLRAVQFLGDPTGLFAVTVRVPKGQVHTYTFLLDGRPAIDAVNPQRARADNGVEWSRFFTDACQIPLELTRREREVLQRLVSHLLPFCLAENRAFIRGVYDQLDRAARAERFPLAYRLDEEVGVVNYIDKVIARTERHNADDYHTCLRIIDELLRGRTGGLDPADAAPELYADLYAQMGADTVPGWDTGRYGSPRYFLLLLRRHAMTGAFAHPRHGGNSGAAGWMYLEDAFRDAEGRTLFDWRGPIEAPLGHNTDYRG